MNGRPASNFDVTLAIKIVNFFHSEWASARNINGDIAVQSKEELDANLRLFYAEARTKDGGNYSRSTLLGFRNGLERYLNNPPHKKGIHIATDPAFQQSNQMLDAKLKDMKKHGEQNVKHKPAIEHEDLRSLKESDVISPTTPQGLLYNVWFHVTLYLCRRSFLFLQDENNKWYATNPQPVKQTRQGGIDDTARYICATAFSKVSKTIISLKVTS